MNEIIAQSEATFRVLVFGGTGVFGGRLVDAVLASTTWQVVVAGRSAERTEAFVAVRHARYDVLRIRALVLDATTCTTAALAAAGAQVVVNAAGPFQGADYALAMAAIGARCHYVDYRRQPSVRGGLQRGAG